LSPVPYRSKVNMPDLTRRDFLKIAATALLTASGLLGLGGLFRFLDYQQAESATQTEFDLGLASAFPIDSHALLADVPAVLFHKKSGFGALSLVCAHLGCTVEQKADGFICPCHGSRYDADGNLLRGPSQKSLRTLRIETAPDGHLILHTD
jgi:cytochrome b6-f complex iron-sulfur subunit